MGSFFIGVTMNFIKQLWRGERSLVLTFWFIGVALTALMAASVIYAAGLQPFLKAYALMIFFQISFVTFITVSVFRSSDNYLKLMKAQYSKKVYWGYLARLCVIALVCWLLFTDIVFYLYNGVMKDF